MENQEYGLTSAESIRELLQLWPQLKVDFEDAWKSIAEQDELIYKDKSFGFSWCQFYELSFKQHYTQHVQALSQDINLRDIFHGFEKSKDKIGHIPQALSQVDSYFDFLEPPRKQEAEDFMPMMGASFGSTLSIYNSFRCVLYYGCFLNELIERARIGDDEALFNAIRIDSTVVGCQTAALRISKAAFLQDQGFFKKLKAAINGKLSKREQANYQKMRLVLEILHEAKSEKLNDDQLQDLFVDTLNLYSWNERDGGNAKALRKFVDTYLKKQATT